MNAEAQNTRVLHIKIPYIQKEHLHMFHMDQ